MKIIKYENNNCAPCTLVSNYLDSKGITYERINPFEEPELAIKDEVYSVPVTILFDDQGKEIKRSIGFNPNELDQLISKL